MALFGSLGKWLGKGLKGVSKVAGFIPGVGTIAGAAMGGLGELMEKGSKTNFGNFLKSTAGGAMGGFMGGAVKGAGFLGTAKNLIAGGGLGKILGGAGLAAGAGAVAKGAKSMKKDQKKARELAGMSEGLYGQMAQGATDRYAENDAMRQAFRHGVMNGADPSNPFARKGAFDQFQSLATQDIAAADPARTAQPRNATLGSMMGGRKIGDPVNRGASRKGVPNNQKMDRGYDERDNGLYSRMA